MCHLWTWGYKQTFGLRFLVSAAQEVPFSYFKKRFLGPTSSPRGLGHDSFCRRDWLKNQASLVESGLGTCYSTDQFHGCGTFGHIDLALGLAQSTAAKLEGKLQSIDSAIYYVCRLRCSYSL